MLARAPSWRLTYAAAEGEAAQLSGAAAGPGVAVLLGEDQDEGHGQREVVEAVDVRVVPLLTETYVNIHVSTHKTTHS